MNPTDFQLDRNDVLPKLIPEPDKYLIIAGLQEPHVTLPTSVEWKAVILCDGRGHGRGFNRSWIGLAQPEKRSPGMHR